MKKRKLASLRPWRRAARVRAKVRGTPARPRLSVFRSSRHIYAQLIDDVSSRTLLAVSDETLQSSPPAGDTKVSPPGGARRKEITAFWVGKELAERARGLGIRKVRFDRGAYAYHGRAAKVAEGARAGGLEL